MELVPDLRETHSQLITDTGLADPFRTGIDEAIAYLKRVRGLGATPSFPSQPLEKGRILLDLQYGPNEKTMFPKFDGTIMDRTLAALDCPLKLKKTQMTQILSQMVEAGRRLFRYSPLPRPDVSLLRPQETLLDKAVYYCKASIEAELFYLEANGLPISISDEKGRTPLHVAVMHENIGAVEALLQCPHVNRRACDTDGRTALHWAALRGSAVSAFRLCKVLPRFAGFEEKDVFGMTAFDYALSGKHNSTAMQLLKMAGLKIDAALVHSIDSPQERTPNFSIHCNGSSMFAKGGRNSFVFDETFDSEFAAVTGGHTEIEEPFINDYEFNISADKSHWDLSSSREYSARLDHWLSHELVRLHSHAAHSSKEGMEQFLSRLKRESLASLINSSDKDGRTSIHFAVMHGNMGTLSALLNCPEVILHARDKDGRTALHWAVLNRNPKAVAQLCRCLPQYPHQLLPNIKDVHGKNALDYASEMGQPEIEMELMKREDVKAYVDGLYQDRQVHADKVNAVLALSTTIITTIVAGTFGALLISSNDPGGLYVLQNQPIIRVLTILSFLFGVTAAVTAVSSHTQKNSIGATVRYISRTSRVASVMLALSGICFLVALAVAGVTVF